LNSSEYLGVTHNTNYAAYGQATFDITDKLSAIGGVRRNLQKIDYTFTNFFANLHFGQANQEWSTTGKTGLEYKWTPDIMTFATWSTGYKGQAYDLVSTFNAREAARMPVPHETARNYEVGLKSSLFDRRVYFDLTLFDADYHGFQTSVTSTLPDGTFLTALNSVGHLRTRGVEIDASAKPMPNLTLNASFAYTNATIVEFPNGPCYNSNPAIDPGCHLDNTNSNTQDLAGKPLNNVPKVKFNIGGEYDQPLPGMPFSGLVSFAYRHQSDVNFTLSQDPRTVQRAYGIADFTLGINDNHDHYKVTFFVDNAFDKRYAVGLSDGTAGFSGIPGAVGSSWNPPRDAFRYYGGRVDVSF
jgi:iron complex outermembrane receptor protein